MAFTEYRFDKNMIKALVAERSANLLANSGHCNLLSFGVGVVAQRLSKDARRYRDYGPYWWALKAVMHANGYDFGKQSDPFISQAYRGETDEATLIMADEFRTMYLKSYIVYTNRFMLDADNPEFYVLYDEDMEFPM